MTVTIQPMTATEYQDWLAPTLEAYARAKVASGEWPADGAPARARREHAELLPHATATPDHHLFTAYDRDEPVGVLWLFVSAERADAFIYDIAVDKAHRGRGLGRELLAAAEGWSRGRGMRSVSLHVFGRNTVARRLYESSGYEVTDLSMTKPLT